MPPRQVLGTWSEGLASLTTVLWLHSTDFLAGALLSRPLDAVWGPLTLQAPPVPLSLILSMWPGLEEGRQWQNSGLRGKQFFIINVVDCPGFPPKMTHFWKNYQQTF